MSRHVFKSETITQLFWFEGLWVCQIFLQIERSKGWRLKILAVYLCGRILIWVLRISVNIKSIIARNFSLLKLRGRGERGWGMGGAPGDCRASVWHFDTREINLPLYDHWWALETVSESLFQSNAGHWHSWIWWQQRRNYSCAWATYLVLAQVFNLRQLTSTDKQNTLSPVSWWVFKLREILSNTPSKLLACSSVTGGSTSSTEFDQNFLQLENIWEHEPTNAIL